MIRYTKTFKKKIDLDGRFVSLFAAMPKAKAGKRNGATASTPYEKTKSANNIFKMNTNLGQHILKNPGVAEAIVNKADLKQSDVCQLDSIIKHGRTNRLSLGGS
jgi:hypothetical protein